MHRLVLILIYAALWLFIWKKWNDPVVKIKKEFFKTKEKNKHEAKIFSGKRKQLTTVLKLNMKSNCGIQIQCKDYRLAYERDLQQNKQK